MKSVRRGSSRGRLCAVPPKESESSTVGSLCLAAQYPVNMPPDFGT